MLYPWIDSENNFHVENISMSQFGDIIGCFFQKLNDLIDEETDEE